MIAGRESILGRRDLPVLGGGITLRAGTLRKTDPPSRVSRLSRDGGHRGGHPSHARHHRSYQRLVYRDLDGRHRGQPAAGGQRLAVTSAERYSPGEVISFFGARVGPSTPAYGQFDRTGVLESNVGDVSIEFDGIPAPVFYAGQNQMNVQVPYEVAAQKESTTMVATFGGQAVESSPFPSKHRIPASARSPMPMEASRGRNHRRPSAARSGLVPGTGAGIPGKPAKTGMPSPPNATVQAMVTVGGISAAPLYAGLTPGGVGLMQVNFTIPAGSPSGDKIPLKSGLAIPNRKRYTFPSADEPRWPRI